MPNEFAEPVVPRLVYRVTKSVTGEQSIASLGEELYPLKKKIGGYCENISPSRAIWRSDCILLAELAAVTRGDSILPFPVRWEAEYLYKSIKINQSHQLPDRG